MGSSYFYLEFLLSLLTLLSTPPTPFTNPAILALEYTLVPDAAYPVQLEQAMAGYAYALRMMRGQAARVCVAGDSAGGTVVLSMMLRLGELGKNGDGNGNSNGYESSFNGRGEINDARPGMTALISPWLTLHPTSPNTPSDYLDASQLSHYASLYAGSMSPTSPLVSPGMCKDLRLWRAACPRGGFFVMYGREEVFAPDIGAWIKMLEDGGVDVGVEVEEGGFM
ncbi:putative steryl acetyl hydrolase, partial [Lachnellula occidentalis]